MILELSPPPTNDPIILSDSPTRELVASTIQGQPWSEITFIVLRRDEANWFEISGSLDPNDGLSARYSENGQEMVSATAPGTLEEASGLMLSYFDADDRWRQAIGWV